MEKDETIINVLQNIRLWLFVIWLTLIGTMILNVVSANAADLPHYADLTFTDIPDLDARVDSVLSICQVDSMISGYEWNITTNESRTVYHRWQVCRRFAGLTIMWMPYIERHPHGQFTYQDKPGKARLWWWEEEE